MAGSLALSVIGRVLVFEVKTARNSRNSRSRDKEVGLIVKGINRSTAVDIEVVRQFLADLRRNAEFVETAPDNMLGNPDAAKVSSTTATVIVRLPLDVRLSRVFLLAGAPGYGGILIAPEEVRAIGKQTRRRSLYCVMLFGNVLGCQ